VDYNKKPTNHLLKFVGSRHVVGRIGESSVNLYRDNTSAVNFVPITSFLGLIMHSCIEVVSSAFGAAGRYPVRAAVLSASFSSV
jgi:hypothetical protein